VFVVVVVAAIALAAGFDALRGEPEPEPAAQTEREPPTVSTSPEPVAPAPEEEFGGILYYTDENCELQAVELPGPTPTEAPNWDECRFVLSPDGRRVSPAGSGWDPHSDPLRGRVFQAEAGTIQVSTNAGPEGEPFAGGAPAWRPDGTLTYFADGAVRVWPDGEVLLSQRDLVQAMRGSPIPQLRNRFQRFRMREAAWLDDRRLAAILSAEGEGHAEDMLAIYDGALVEEFHFDDPGGFTELRASPNGRYIAAKASGRGPAGFVLIEPGSGEVNSPGIVGYRAITWSPDEQWAAVAADGGLFVFRPGVRGPPDLELDLNAQDLDWRGSPTLAASDETREWIADLRLTGRLFVAQSEGSGCTVRAIQLPGLDWAEEPPGLPAPCRFTLDDRSGVVAEDTVPQPGGDEMAQCHEGALDWFSETGLIARYRGACGPSWTPDGRLTFVRDGALYEAVPPDNQRRLLSRGSVSELLGRPSEIEEIAWVDDERFWAVVRSGESAIVALMTTDQLVFSPSFTTQRIEGLRVSATGMVAARTDQGVVFFDTGGRRALTFPEGRAVAWAPGELIAAVAMPTEVLFVAPVSREVLSLPLEVRDLEWVVP